MRLPRAWNNTTGKKCSSNGCRLDHVSHLNIDEDTALVQGGGAVATPPSPTFSFSAHVRLWPPNRLIWPPPRFVHQEGGVGAAGIRTQKWCGARVQGGRGRVTTNVMVRDLDLPRLDVTDGRR